jgi:sodium pump decarboxylase gamma subunit
VIDLEEKVTLLDSLIVTVFSVTVVFGVLILIAFLIRFLKALSIEKKKEQVENIKQEAVANKVDEIIEDSEQADDEELVAVISAAIAASLGVSIPEINIKAIRRINQPIPSWAQAGRTEQIMKRL